MAKLNGVTDLNTIYATALEQADWADFNKETVKVNEIRDYGFVVIRIRQQSKGADAALTKLGIALPDAQGLIGNPDTRLVKWISPDEYLVTLPLAEKDHFIREATAALKGVFSAVVDNSGAYSLLSITGSNALNMLSKITFYDVRHNLPTGKVVSTLMTKSPVIFYRLKDDTIHCMVRWSFANYALKVLEKACEEYS